MFVDISEKNVLILFIFGTVIRYRVVYACKTVVHVPNLSMATFSYILGVCCDISEKNGLILFIFGTLIKYHML